MNKAIDTIQNNVRAAIQKFINHAEESEMKLETRNTERGNWLTGHISMKTPTKMLAGIALGAMLTWAGVSSYSALADEPKSPLVTAKQLTIQAEKQDTYVLPRNTFTDLEKLVIQAEMEDGYGETRNTFTDLESLVIQAEMEDGFGETRNTFTDEELLIIQAEMEDAYVEPRNTFTDLERLVIQAEVEDGYGETRNTFTDLEKLVIQAEVEDGFGETRNTFTDLERLVIQAEMEDGFGGVIEYPGKQVDMSHAGGDRSVLEALQSHDVGSVFLAEEWLQIIAEIEDAV